MGISATFTVTGADEISARFQEIKSAVQQFVDTYPGKVADEMVGKMQDLAPVRTGYLRDHIVTTGVGGGSATVESQAGYSIYVEFGTRYMSAQPFFFPVWDEYNSDKVMSDFKSEVLT